MPSLYCSLSLILLLLLSILWLDLSNSLQLYRAILASTKLQSKLNRDFFKTLSQHQKHQQHFRGKEVESGQVVFTVDATTSETISAKSCKSIAGSLSFLNYLPVSRIRIVAARWQVNAADEGNCTVLDGEDEVDDQFLSHNTTGISRIELMQKIESAVSTWKRLGNSIQSVGTNDNNEPSVQFSLTSSSLRISSRMRRQKKRQGMYKARDKHKNLASSVARQIESHFGWKRVARQQSLAFHLVEGSDDQYSLELTALTRTFPLRDRGVDEGSNNNDQVTTSSKEKNKQKKKSRKRQRYEQKRIESFIVAKAADIRQGEHVLDPLCGRATILIEAVKYWPLAGAYYGVDRSIPHLEHAVMNADSTKTCLDLRLGKPFDLPLESNSIDKIVTCLPFNKSEKYYRGLLREWCRVLKTVTGKMVLVIDQHTLSSLSAAVDSLDDCYITFVRSAFLWGNDRVMIVIVDNGGKESAKGSSQNYRHEIFEWERHCYDFAEEHKGCSSMQDRQNWVYIRAKTQPPLVPYTQAQNAIAVSNTFTVSTGLSLPKISSPCKN